MLEGNIILKYANGNTRKVPLGMSLKVGMLGSKDGDPIDFDLEIAKQAYNGQEAVNRVAMLVQYLFEEVKEVVKWEKPDIMGGG